MTSGTSVRAPRISTATSASVPPPPMTVGILTSEIEGIAYGMVAGDTFRAPERDLGTADFRRGRVQIPC